MRKVVSIAPMMGYTDRHARYLLRLMSPSVVLYTEMLTTQALLQGRHTAALAFDQAEHPVVLQLGGSNPKQMAQCAVLAEQAGYDEVNINVGCPSDRVQSGYFGACLMKEPALVAECVAKMHASVKIPVTVKTRIGIDRTGFEFLTGFVEPVAAAGCRTFIIHARHAWLKGLNPKQNRHIPPLDYEAVYRLKAQYPQLNIIINGGIDDVAQIQAQLRRVDGVMIGRQAYKAPYFLTEVDRVISGLEKPPLSRREVVMRYSEYMARQVGAQVSLWSMVRHALGLYYGQPGAKQWRRYLTEQTNRERVDHNVLIKALERLPDS